MRICFNFIFRAVELGIGPSKHMRNFTKKVAKKFPESPKDVDEIIEYFAHESIRTTIGRTLRNENETATPFFKHAEKCEGFAFCLFASDDVIEEMGKISPYKRLLFFDGTFRVVPYGDFAQLFILSVDINGQVSWHFAREFGFLF